MRKILLLGAVALGVALASEQQAQAWLNFKFGAGINWNWQSGGNNLLWGVFRNGQPPGPDCGPGMGHGYHHGHPQTFPGFQQYGPQDFQYFGNRVPPNQPPMPQGTQAPVQGQNPVAQYYQNPSYARPNYFQPVSYNSYPAYYYTGNPTYGSGNMPLYWGR